MRASAILLIVWSPLVLLSLTGCGSPQPPAVEAPKPEPEPPPPQPIALAGFQPLTLQPGAEANVELKVERNGNEGPVEIKLGELPKGITVEAPKVSAEESAGSLTVKAAQSLGDEPLATSVEVTASIGEQTASQPLAVNVPKLNLPSLQPMTAVLLQPGTSRTVDVKLNRNGFQGAVPLSVEGATEKVQCKLAAASVENDATKLEITAARDAPNADLKIRVATTLFGRKIGAELPIKVESKPFDVDSFRVVTIEPGKKQRVELPIKRGSYKGSLQLGAEGLPKGVKVSQVEAAPGATTAVLELEAAPGLEQRVKSSRVVSKAGHLTDSGPIVIRIGKEDDTYLPPALTANPEIAPLLRRGSIGGRLTSETKQALLDFYGGTPESEAAVMHGLKWLAGHQHPDGSWPLHEYSKDIPGCDCQGEFENGVDKCVVAGTAFGVLPFLGAGVTHNRAPKSPPELAAYQKVVENGLIFLARGQKRSNDDKDGHLGGSMYAHALGTIAFCEAYGLSGDDRLKINAQLALKYLFNAQHSEGGWRYSPKQAGDMSVTGWVFLAIRSAQLAGIDIQKLPLTRAGRFAESCAVGPEEAKLSRYAYMPGQDERLALSAAGLLTQQYLGWPREEPNLIAGSEYLMQHLPPESGGSLGAIYYHYYATQVLHHMEGPNFDLWNHRMREHLIRTQQKSGHKAGSWNPDGADQGKRGGRMYATGMALLTLEVYYRHLPMYRHVKRTM
ncbi:MAG: terpene cyclase/mutase family protein [Planctomycetaceae bacterium]|nr:terpene cyclase/mutase family protein [Planctomycetaceae bacterium]